MKVSYRIDLHTHSYGSPDGSLKARDYQTLLSRLDYIAITDHGTVKAAQHIKTELGEQGKRIIVGEEIKTTDGEIIGLYLKKTIPQGLSPQATVAAIRTQGGLVYVPHPFETVRSGISEASLEKIIADVDIIEVWNGRAVFQNRAELAVKWSTRHNLAAAASSDAHGVYGWGRTYSIIHTIPTHATLVALLKQASYSKKTVGLGILYPNINRIRKKCHAA